MAERDRDGKSDRMMEAVIGRDMFLVDVRFLCLVKRYRSGERNSDEETVAT